MILFVLILIASLLLQLFLPWWIIAPVAFAFTLWKGNSARQSFLAGFAAIFILWLGVAFITDIQNDSILSAKIAEMLFVKYSALLLIVTALIGGLVGGLSAWTGYLWKKASTK
ncbi:hypothetical protein QNI19_14110 [Cytophagaceae bacterium DM2B3-1]|uniref:Uncharacterized protein n=1 Tax=Xanthocytophaga flava TaxID=3048013 RepID=A0ABT7CK00_9BACT|nr:hypothetical protein [Xanthocytophaga flavus]MDJ1469415.1 hypothetical protein [Xanthocytophaga flavus]MDJ1494073.1 hypothetical protein [Xanthocytophaga flavus]